jgi:hypothetical protein
MTTFREIKDFLVIQKDNEHQVFIKHFETDSFILSEEETEYIIGYKGDLGSRLLTDGEFAIIKLNKQGYEIYNDIYGIVTIYHYKEEGVNYFSTFLPSILDRVSSEISLDYKRLAKYFAFGYQLVDAESHYKGVKAYQEPINITCSDELLTIKLVNRDSFFKENNKEIDFHSVFNSMEDAIINKVNITKDKNSLFLMTGGQDSLLSAMILKRNGLIFDTGTFGLRSSLDIIYGKKRTKKIFNSKNINFFVEDIKLIEEDFFEHANLQSGFGTLSSVYFTKYFKMLSEMDYKYLYFSEYYEATRKMPLNIDRIKKAYITPDNVLADFFLDIGMHTKVVAETIERILDKYKENAVAKYYLFDRNIKGGHWKTPIGRNFGLTKVNLSYELDFINKNYSYLLKNGFIYEEALSLLLKKLSIDRSEVIPEFSGQDKHIAISPQQMIYEYASFFIKLLDSSRSSDLFKFFDIEKLIERIDKKGLKDKDEWFALRLVNLIAFSLKNKISLNIQS